MAGEGEVAGAGAGAGRKEKRAPAVAESLGWLTESAVMPKKHRAIEGVGATSILELKAQLYRTQEEARKAKQDASSSGAGDAAEFLSVRRRPAAPDVFARRNSGVESRAHRDKLELKAANDGSASYAALERKAELYEKLSRGELSDEEEKEKYCVDFFAKSLVQGETELHEVHDSPGVPPVNEDDDADAVFLATKLIGPGRTSVTMDKDEHKRFVREVHEEASGAREKASLLKLRRQEQEAARRERLKQAYLRKQLEKLKAAKAEPS